MKPLIALVLSVLLTGCSGVDVVNALTPRTGYRVQRDLAYGPDPRQRLDLYIPDQADGEAPPVLVFFYGGRWEFGSKADYGFVGQAFASRGYVVAIADYRLYPQVRFPAFVQDGAEAVAFAARQAGRPGQRPVYLAGHSAGAYIAAMVALDRRWLAAAGMPDCLVSAVVGLSGPYDFLPLDSEDLIQIFGPGPAGADTQPVTHVDAGAPPMLLATGTADHVVRPANSLRLAERLRAAGVDGQTRLYEGRGHVTPVAALAAPLRFLDPVLEDSLAFFEAHGSRCGGAAP